MQVSHTKGIAQWRELISVEVKLPVDARQMPDTFVYLCKDTKRFVDAPVVSRAGIRWFGSI